MDRTNQQRIKIKRMERASYANQESNSQETNEAAGEDDGRTTFLIPPPPGSSSPNLKYHPRVYDLKSYVIEPQLKLPYPTLCRNYTGYFMSDGMSRKKVHIKVVDEDINKIRVTATPPISHRNITPQIYIKRKELGLAFVVMPHMALGSARDLLGLFPLGMPEQHIALLLKDVLLAMKALHSQGYVHRDVKPSNILITDNPEPVIQLCSSYYVPNLTSLHPVTEEATPPYHLPPELLNNQQHTFYQQAHSYKHSISDIWSIGVTALELAHAKPPISEDVPWSCMYSRVNNRIENANKPKPFSDSFKQFVALCLKHIPEERPLASELLKLPFFKSENTSSIKEFLSTIAELNKASQVRTVARWAFDSHSLKLKPDICAASCSPSIKLPSSVPSYSPDLV